MSGQFGRFNYKSKNKTKIMAKTKKCPYCSTVMYIESEKEEPMGSYVVYECKNGNCKHVEKTFVNK